MPFTCSFNHTKLWSTFEQLNPKSNATTVNSLAHNWKLISNHQDSTLYFRYIFSRHKSYLPLADQDILNAIFGTSPWWVLLFIKSLRKYGYQNSNICESFVPRKCSKTKYHPSVLPKISIFGVWIAKLEGLVWLCLFCHNPILTPNQSNSG